MFYLILLKGGKSTARQTVESTSRLIIVDFGAIVIFLVMLRFPNFDFRSISIRFLAQNDDFDSIQF